MKDIEKLRGSKHLHGNTIWELSSDMLYDTGETEWSGVSYRPLAAWFLRNYLHMSFNQIAALLCYRDGYTAAEAVYDLESLFPEPVDLRGENVETLEAWRVLCREYYGIDRNPILYRCTPDLEEALLWSANGNGMSDKYNKLNSQWYTATPTKPPSLYNILLLIEDYESGVEDFHFNYNVTQTL